MSGILAPNLQKANKLTMTLILEFPIIQVNYIILSMYHIIASVQSFSHAMYSFFLKRNALVSQNCRYEPHGYGVISIRAK